MSESTQSSVCGSCGESVEETPCPHCGSLLRSIHVSVNEPITVREKLGTTQRRDGKKRPVSEQVHGDDLYRKTGTWMKLSRVIDRENDLYHKIITNPETGEVVHECKEPLSAHRGHGDAKKKI